MEIEGQMENYKRGDGWIYFFQGVFINLFLIAYLLMVVFVGQFGDELKVLELSKLQTFFYL